MSLVTPAELKEHVETDLGDVALQRIIDAAEADCVALAGAVDSARVETLRGGDKFLFLPVPASAFTSVVETVSPNGTPTALIPADYQVWNGGWQIERLGASYWGWEVVVTFTPVTDDTRRTMVVINLCKLELQYNGLVQESAGGMSMTVGDYEQKRRQILSRLRGGLPVA